MKKASYLLIQLEEKVTIGVLVLVFICRFALPGKGLMYFPDEGRYFASTSIVKEFGQGNFRAGLAALNSTQGRPGDVICHLPVAVVQGMLFKISGMNTNTPATLVLNSWVNCLWLVASAYLFSRISRKVLPRSLANLALVIYVCLINSNLYIRHVLPYDEALCFFFLALLLILQVVTETAANVRLVWAGLAAGASYLTYPGYFVGPIFLVIILLLSANASKNQMIKQGLLFVTGFTAVILFFEFLVRLGGSSYLLASQKLSGTISQGDFSAGYSFLPEYMLVVEGVMGGCLLLLLVYATYSVLFRHLIALRQFSFADKGIRFYMLIALWICWILYASLAFIMHKFVFYGRIVHLYLPFVVLCGLMALVAYESQRWVVFLRYTLISISVISFIHFFLDYRSIIYPRDVLYSLSIYNPIPKDTKFYTESDSQTSLRPAIFQPLYYNNHSQTPYTSGLKLVDMCLMYPIVTYKKVNVSGKLLVEYPHIAEYIPYQYEGYSAEERRLLATYPYVFQVYH